MRGVRRRVLGLLLVPVVAVAGCGEGSSESSLPDLQPMRFPEPADSAYCLPYPVGESAWVSQSWSDTGTHRGRFAYDFSMPFGAQVTAARGGTVTEIRDEYADDDPTGGHENGVFVLHDDGTMAMYLHLAEDGVLVDVDETVTLGQVIGSVGTTGTSVPHLHFEVFEGQGDGTQWYRTLPVSFRNATQPLDDWGGLFRIDYESLPCEPQP